MNHTTESATTPKRNTSREALLNVLSVSALMGDAKRLQEDHQPAKIRELGRRIEKNARTLSDAYSRLLRRFTVGQAVLDGDEDEVTEQVHTRQAGKAAEQLFGGPVPDLV